MTRRALAAIALLAAVALTGGCVGAIDGAKLEPKVAPPAIGEKGVLRAVVDLSYPPFGGTDNGTRAGLDVDVAAALADRLGLTLRIVNAKPAAAARMLKAGRADVALGALTVEQAVSGDYAFAGTYVSDAPAVFSKSGGKVGIGDLGGKKVAVQKESYAYWVISGEYGEDAVVLMPTLREALTAVAAGQADYAAGDAIVGSYLLRDFPGLRYCGQVAPAYPLGVGVAKSDPKLEAAVRSALDDLSAKGVLTTLRRKWAGDLPTLDAGTASDSEGGSTDASATP